MADPAPASDAPYTHATRDGMQVVTFPRKPFDERRTVALQDGLRRIVAESQPAPTIILCCQNLKYASSQLLGVVMDVALKATRGNGRMRVVGMNPAVLDLYRLTRMDRVVPHHATLEEAIESLRPPASP